MNRRSFIRGMTTLIAAPAIVRASSLMPLSTAFVGDAEMAFPDQWVLAEREAIRVYTWTAGVLAETDFRRSLPPGASWSR